MDIFGCQVEKGWCSGGILNMPVGDYLFKRTFVLFCVDNVHVYMEQCMHGDQRTTFCLQHFFHFDVDFGV